MSTDKQCEEPTRAYRSPLREARAAETRDRIVSAAAELFLCDGFDKTTVSAIARQAGVSGPTVFNVFGSKGQIMRALLARMEEAADAATWRTRIAEDDDPAAKLAHFAEWTREMFATSRALLVVSLRAGDEPAVQEFHQTGDRNRRGGLEPIIAAIDRAGALPQHLNHQQALDIAWVLTAPDLYVRSTDGCGWTDDDYQRWLTDTLQQQLLAEERPA